MKPIYIPKGRAGEYGDYAVNIYTGCPHRCYYCFAPQVLRRERERFHSCVEPRPGIVDAVKRQLDKEGITEKLIHLCFTCDPYPRGYGKKTTREVIRALKEAGNHIQILTKNPAEALDQDMDLLDGADWFGTTISSFGIIARNAEPGAEEALSRWEALKWAKNCGIQTWLSCEPVLSQHAIERIIGVASPAYDRIKIGKLNYWPSYIDWAEFGRKCEELCQLYHRDYYIKDDLRKEMEKGSGKA